jgi:predicted branched-subunit amino acid permease
MASTTTQLDRESNLRKTIRSRRSGYSKTIRNHRLGPRGPSQTRSLSSNHSELIEDEQPSTAGSSSAFTSGAKAAVSASLGLIPLAIALGAAAVGSGLSTLEALAMSVFVLSAAAQMAMIELISTGAPAAVIVLTVLIISLRLTMYSASLAPHFRKLPAGWKGLLSYLLTDPAYALSITRFDAGETKQPNKRWYFLGAALAIWITWQAGTVAGVFLGSRVPEGLSLEFFLPLTFIALALPAIKDRATSAAALSAGVAAVFAAALPLNLGLLTAALVGVLLGLLAEVVTERRSK